MSGQIMNGAEAPVHVRAETWSPDIHVPCTYAHPCDLTMVHSKEWKRGKSCFALFHCKPTISLTMVVSWMYHDGWSYPLQTCKPHNTN